MPLTIYFHKWFAMRRGILDWIYCDNLMKMVWLNTSAAKCFLLKWVIFDKVNPIDLLWNPTREKQPWSNRKWLFFHYNNFQIYWIRESQSPINQRYLLLWNYMFSQFCWTCSWHQMNWRGFGVMKYSVDRFSCRTWM